jgi:hypothetical protein
MEVVASTRMRKLQTSARLLACDTAGSPIRRTCLNQLDAWDVAQKVYSQESRNFGIAQLRLESLAEAMYQQRLL